MSRSLFPDSPEFEFWEETEKLIHGNKPIIGSDPWLKCADQIRNLGFYKRSDWEWKNF
jgi:hypothetical protein